MLNCRLEIKNNSAPFSVYLPIALDFNLADVREPDKRKASGSKTIQLFATNEINKLFENIFEVNLKTQYFNKNLKTHVKYFVNEMMVFNGSLQLIKIVLKPDTNIIYECSVIGNDGNLFIDIGEKLITGNADSADDLDFSAYNHNYTRANQISLRSNHGTGLGVLYPLIDRGSNNGSDNEFNTEDFIPCFHNYEIVKKIIEKTGRTFTSSILNGTEFKKQITYPNTDSLLLTSGQLANKQFFTGLSADYTMTNGASYVVNTPNESAPFFDVGNQVFGTYAILNQNGFYNMVTSSKYKMSFTHTDATVTYMVAGIQTIVTLRKSGDGGVSWFTLTNNTSNIGGAVVSIFNKATDYFHTNEVATGEQFFSGGDHFEHRSQYILTYVKYYNASNVEITTGTGTVLVTLLSGAGKTSFYALCTKKTIIAGDMLYVNNALPTKIKQKDYLKSIIQALNLYVEVDPSDENNLIIESFDTFYNTLTPLNWENKTDLDKEQTINPNLLEGKRYIYTYKSDADYYNELYKNKYNEVFGTEIIDVENDFIKTDKVNELIFSATPNVANYGLGIAHPRIYKIDGGIKKTLTPNIRWLICAGVKNASNPITYKERGQPDLITTEYLYAGHTDDPFNPTVDLNFGTPRELFYSFTLSYFTNNNNYNRFHKYYLETITDRDSKITTKYLWVNPKDINQFSFRRRLFIDGAYWLVNKIVNYDSTKEESTQFELIKLSKSNVFVPTSTLLSDSFVMAGIEYTSTERTMLTTGTIRALTI